MIATFADAATEDVFDGRDSRRARGVCPSTLWRVARRKLDLINRATDLRDLAAPAGNRLERLDGDRGPLERAHQRAVPHLLPWEEGYAYDVEITEDH